ncbi:MAG TPA: hypothetical protein VFE62_08790, partial [Gemmataceae bacterium]|nr:hypothetical protein [Gemmataceae bacterium]
IKATVFPRVVAQTSDTRPNGVGSSGDCAMPLVVLGNSNRIVSLAEGARPIFHLAFMRRPRIFRNAGLVFQVASTGECIQNPSRTLATSNRSEMT